MKTLTHADKRQKSDFYLREYEKLFSNLLDKPINLLELGVYNGDSLVMWKNYFTNGNIIGMDLRIDHLSLPAGIKVYQGDQTDISVLDKIRTESAPDGFDIIIDDASHIGHLTRKSFWHLFNNHLKAGGIYCVEDWGTGYWPSADYDGKQFVEGQPHFAGMVGFIKELVDECGIEDALHARKSKFERIQISLGQCFVFKKNV